MKQELPKRKPTRLRNFDYSTAGAYFITVCTKNRREILSRVGADVLGGPNGVALLPYGKIAEKYIRQFSEFYENITVDQYVIMPDHVHIVLFVENGGSPRTSTPTRQTASVSLFVSTLKRFCNKEYGENVWQRGFYDHVIRGQEDYEEIVKYILENPARYYYGKLYTEEE